MTIEEAKERIRRGLTPFECGFEGGRYESDPIRFQVRDLEGTPIYSGAIPKSEYASEELLTNRVRVEKEAVLTILEQRYKKIVSGRVKQGQKIGDARTEAELRSLRLKMFGTEAGYARVFDT